jgi:hypothetical protein
VIRGRTRGVLALVAAAGFVAGAVVTLASTGGSDGDPATAGPNGAATTAAPSSAALATTEPPPPSIDDPATDPPTTAAPTTATTAAPTTSTAAVPADDGVLLVWTSQGLGSEVAPRVAALPGVAASTVVAGEQLGLVASWDELGAPVDSLDDGWQIPLDVLGIEPAGFAAFATADAETFAALGPDQALLTRTSADLRDVGVGGRLQIVGDDGLGGEVTVVGVVDDEAGAGAEVLVDRATAQRIGATTDRYLLVQLGAPRADVEAAIDALMDPQRPVRFRSRAETTWLRHGDAVLPLALIKARFGEFSFRFMAGRDVQVDPVWEAEHIVREELPLLGVVECHEDLLPALRGAMQSLADRGLGHVVDPDGFRGCYVPRRIGAGQRALSRHSWGAAVDLNAGDAPRGTEGSQPQELIDAMDAHGFTSGAGWLEPDRAHYEWSRDV